MSGPAPAAGPGVRIVHVSDTFAPRVGGIETQVAGLADRQAHAGADVRVLTAAAGERNPVDADAHAPRRPGRYRRTELRPSGVRVHRLATPLTLGVPVHPREGKLLARALARLTAGRAPGSVVVHAHAGVVSPFALAGVRAALRAGVPTVVTWHSVLDGALPALRGVAAWAGVAGPGVPLVATAVSERAADGVRALLGRPAVAIVPNGLDVEWWARAAATARRATAPGSDAEPLRLVAVQRLSVRKRPEALVRCVLDAEAELARQAPGAPHPRLTLTLAGGGSRERRVRALVRARTEAGGPQVARLLGSVPRSELPDLHAAHDVFVTATRLEAFGIAALEARACGLPVVAPRGSGPQTFLRDGIDSLLVADDGGLTDALVALGDPAGPRRTLVEAARRAPPPGDWGDALGACEAAYADARRRARSGAAGSFHSNA